ncbi:ImpB/MucB/SamB family protein [Toxoplasma gondii GT1]|uniref:ImpB/MucB/SamB family protein n=2 Tax=Toxoplasma gondii TaxID=5811 RepID=S7UVV8_TOXGG|nr:ImpB/MucB/SamB family protein [Toxoplasma gondii GT1]KAF4640311.1 ImpB/MucB/SamB family protein [Toxoplasma gondii]
MLARARDTRRTIPVVVHLDLDCFYCQVEHRRLGIPVSEPLVVRQWNLAIAVNYAARRLGIKRGDLCTVLEKKFPNLHIIHVDLLHLVNDSTSSSSLSPCSSSSSIACSSSPCSSSSSTSCSSSPCSSSSSTSCSSSSSLSRSSVVSPGLNGEGLDGGDLSGERHGLGRGKEGEEQMPSATVSPAFSPRREKGATSSIPAHVPSRPDTDKVSLERYRLASDEVLSIIVEQYPCVERASIDEVFIDLSNQVADILSPFFQRLELNRSSFPSSLSSSVPSCSTERLNETEDGRREGIGLGGASSPPSSAGRGRPDGLDLTSQAALLREWLDGKGKAEVRAELGALLPELLDDQVYVHLAAVPRTRPPATPQRSLPGNAMPFHGLGRNTPSSVCPRVSPPSASSPSPSSFQSSPSSLPPHPSPLPAAHSSLSPSLSACSSSSSVAGEAASRRVAGFGGPLPPDDVDLLIDVCGGETRRKLDFSLEALWLLVGGVLLLRLRNLVKLRSQFTMSGAVARSKFLAKTASAKFKPDRQVLVPSELAADFLGPLELRDLRGFRGKRGRRIAAAFPDKPRVKDLREIPFDHLVTKLGREEAESLSNVLKGDLEGEGVKANLRVKSMLAFKAFPPGAADPVQLAMNRGGLADWLSGLCLELFRRAEQEFSAYKRAPKTLTVYYRTGPPWFQQLSRSGPLSPRRKALAAPTLEEIQRATLAALLRLSRDCGARLPPCVKIGLAVSDFENAELEATPRITQFFQVGVSERLKHRRGAAAQDAEPRGGAVVPKQQGVEAHTGTRDGGDRRVSGRANVFSVKPAGGGEAVEAGDGAETARRSDVRAEVETEGVVVDSFLAAEKRAEATPELEGVSTVELTPGKQSRSSSEASGSFRLLPTSPLPANASKGLSRRNERTSERDCKSEDAAKGAGDDGEAEEDGEDGEGRRPAQSPQRDEAYADRGSCSSEEDERSKEESSKPDSEMHSPLHTRGVSLDVVYVSDPSQEEAKANKVCLVSTVSSAEDHRADSGDRTLEGREEDGEHGGDGQEARVSGTDGGKKVESERGSVAVSICHPRNAVVSPGLLGVIGSPPRSQDASGAGREAEPAEDAWQETLPVVSDEDKRDAETIPVSSDSEVAIEDEAEERAGSGDEAVLLLSRSPSLSPASARSSSPACSLARAAPKSPRGDLVLCHQCKSLVPLSEVQVHLDEHMAAFVFQETNPKCLPSTASQAVAQVEASQSQRVRERMRREQQLLEEENQLTLDAFLRRQLFAKKRRVDF